MNQEYRPDQVNRSPGSKNGKNNQWARKGSTSVLVVLLIIIVIAVIIAAFLIWKSKSKSGVSSDGKVKETSVNTQKTDQSASVSETEKISEKVQSEAASDDAGAMILSESESAMDSATEAEDTAEPLRLPSASTSSGEASAETETETETEEEIVSVTDVILTSASMNHSAWVVDGHVIIAGEPYEGQESTGDWSDIVQVSISEDHVAALNGDGLAYAAGDNASHQCDIDGQKGIVYVEAGMNCTIAVMGNGRAVLYGVAGEKIRNGLLKEKNISRVDISDTHVVILHRDGTAAAYGNTETGACDVSEWKDLVDIRAGHGFSVGLRSDGTMLFTGEDPHGLNEVTGWDGIQQISAGATHIAGIREDGTVIARGKNRQGECDLEDWKEIQSVAAGYDHTVGLTGENIPCAAGYNGSGQLDVPGSKEETEK